MTTDNLWFYFLKRFYPSRGVAPADCERDKSARIRDIRRSVASWSMSPLWVPIDQATLIGRCTDAYLQLSLS